MRDGPSRYRPVAVGATYPEMLRTDRTLPSLPVAAVVVAVVGFVLIAAGLSQGILGLGWLLAGRPGELSSYLAAGLRFETPLGLLATNLGIAATVVIPIVLIGRGYRVAPHWLSSVCGRFRWRWFAGSLGVAALALGGWVVGSLLIGPGLPLSPGPQFWAYVVVIVLTSPLQATAEEVVFRGFLAQSFGALNTWLAIVAPALIFALLHGVQNPWLFANRFGFGLLAGVLVVATGGLEAAVAVHVVNNLCSLGLSALGDTLEISRTQTDMAPVEAISGLVAYAVCSAILIGFAGIFRISRRVVGDVPGAGHQRN